MVIENVRRPHDVNTALPLKAPPRPVSGSSATTADGFDTTEISPNGDLILAFLHGHNERTKAVHFRVDRRTLSAASPYFRILFDPDRFEEGRRVASLQAPSNGQAVESSLPIVYIEDVGRIAGVKSIQLLLTDFLSLLHGYDLSSTTPPIANIANLAIVADRFDVLPVLRKYIQARRTTNILDSRSSKAKIATQPIERLRQRCLAGLLLEHDPWLESASQALIQRSAPPDQPDGALWHDIPFGIEEELLHRRAYLLDTIQSLPTHFLSRYTSRTRQCRLGYDSSAACDSFQLGEMVKFFSRIGILNLQPNLVDVEGLPSEPSGEDLKAIIEKLRQCPEYQVDQNHRHCGLRTKILPLLDVLDRAVDECGISIDLWTGYRAEYAWSEAKRPLVWRFGASKPGMGSQTNEKLLRLAKVGALRDMCMAKERIWETTGDANSDSTMIEHKR